MRTEEMIFTNDIQLKGTLLIPDQQKETYPAVLFLSGSGRLNRDANAEKGKFQFNLYKDLAELFTSLGFITFRYDKRGVGESGGSFYKAGLSDALRDAESAFDMLSGLPNVDPNKVLVFGHSEGCIVGTALSARKPAAGLILASGAAAGLKESLDHQRMQLFKELSQKKGIQGWIIKKFNTLEKSEKQAQSLYKKMLDTDKDIVKSMGVIKMPAKYFREHFQYDLLEDLRKVSCPVLAISGSKDFQANTEHLDRIPKYVQGEYECHVISNMDHGMKEQLTPLSAENYKKDYLKTIGQPVHKEAVEVLTQWLAKF